MSSSPEYTPKAQQTKEHILSTALKLFERQGYGKTTLRGIAAEADVSLGLTYRYFSRKEDLVLALYEQLAEETAEEASNLERGPVGRRFEASILSCLDRLQPHRGTLESLTSVGLAADSETAVLGDRASGVRSSMWRLYRDVVFGSTDKPRQKQAEQLATLLYSGHMLLVFFWLQDRSEGQRRTRELVHTLAGLLRYLRPLLAIPAVSNTLAELHRILFPMFGPPANATAEQA